MQIVEARGSHLLPIAHVSQALSRPNRLLHRNGFLCDHAVQPRFSDFLNCGSFLVLLDKDEVVGFILAAPITHPGLSLERSLLEQSAWVDAKSRRYLGADNMYVKRVAIAPDFQRRGLGRLLYADLTTRFPQHDLMAAIIEAPHNNSASAKFHLELGFERAAIFQAEGIFGFDQYTAGIYLRPPGPIQSALSELLGRDAA